MSRSIELWEQIKQQILAEELIGEEELENLGSAILEARITSDDWKLSIENTLLRRAENAE